MTDKTDLEIIKLQLENVQKLLHSQYLLSMATAGLSSKKYGVKTNIIKSDGSIEQVA